MVTAFILINTERKRVQETAEALHKIKGITEVYSVAGQYDLVAIIRVKSNEDVAGLVTGNLLKMEGIQRTETLMAFASYSQYDLERLFSVGQDS
ncbi:Lrp/AsnC ligand binding domain-containing protein [Candidatus Sumerlaeota bacterium]|nr:Lrp/AsnC ligand binding domain-containing protein [Candidatus Sumerlaeota bacterium]